MIANLVMDLVGVERLASVLVSSCLARQELNKVGALGRRGSRGTSLRFVTVKFAGRFDSSAKSVDTKKDYCCKVTEGKEHCVVVVVGCPELNAIHSKR